MNRRKPIFPHFSPDRDPTPIFTFHNEQRRRKRKDLIITVAILLSSSIIAIGIAALLVELAIMIAALLS